MRRPTLLSYLKSSSACDRIIKEPWVFRLSPPTVGQYFQEWIHCPSISMREIGSLRKSEDPTITRHIRREHLDITLEGSFKFGTLLEYRPKDESLIGRFSDVQEASQKNYYRSRSNIYNYYSPQTAMTDCMFVGYDYGILIEFFCNDYCSCSSRDSFHLLRALTLRERGNPDIGAYVVYNFSRLVAAIQEVINEEHPHLSLIYQPVIYGDKDRSWHIEEHQINDASRDKLEMWLSTAFVKSVDYSHEEEIRVMLIDRRAPGSLSEASTGLILNDPRIASAIVDHGFF